MLKIHKKIFFLLILILGVSSSARARDELIPERGALAGVSSYHAKIRTVLHRAFDESVYLRAIAEATIYTPEYAVFVSRDGDQRIVNYLVPAKSIWEYQSREDDQRAKKVRRNYVSGEIIHDDPLEPENYRDIKVSLITKTIPNELADALNRVTVDAVSHATYTKYSDGITILDGYSLHFMAISFDGFITGKTHSPKRDTVAHQLVKIYGKLIQYVKGKASDEEIKEVLDEYWRVVEKQRGAVLRRND